MWLPNSGMGLYVLDSVKMLACMLGGCNIGLLWSINGVLIETFPLVWDIEHKGVLLPNSGMRLG